MVPGTMLPTSTKYNDPDSGQTMAGKQRQDLGLNFVFQALPEDARYPTSGRNREASTKSIRAIPQQ